MTRARKREMSSGDALPIYCALARAARTDAPRMRLRDPIPGRSPGRRAGWMSDSSGSPLTDWAAAPIGANKRTPSAVRSSMAPRSTRSDIRRQGPLDLDVKGHRVRGGGRRPAWWPTRGRLARCRRSTAPQPAPWASEPTVWPSTCPSFRRTGPHGGQLPRLRWSGGPGALAAHTRHPAGAGLGPAVASFGSTNATRADSANRDQPSRLVHPRGRGPATRCPGCACSHRGLSIR